jgi:hypothetical protein
MEELLKLGEGYFEVKLRIIRIYPRVILAFRASYGGSRPLIA